jgi:hypothetical protein
MLRYWPGHRLRFGDLTALSEARGHPQVLSNESDRIDRLMRRGFLTYKVTVKGRFAIWMKGLTA